MEIEEVFDVITLVKINNSNNTLISGPHFGNLNKIFFNEKEANEYVNDMLKYHDTRFEIRKTIQKKKGEQNNV